MNGTTGTAKARHIGAELREARNRTGLSVRGLAAQLGMDHTLLSRYETGQRHPQPEDVASILTALGVNGQERQGMIDLARDRDGSAWLGIGMPARQRQLEALLEFERTATAITEANALLISGLLQTADYARAMMSTGGVPRGEIETRVAVRLGRRDALQRRNPVRLQGLIGEAALRQTIGTPTVMADQLRYLQEAAARPNIDIRVIPLASGWNPALEGPFMLLEFDAATPIVHLENRRSGLFLHEPPDVQAYQEAADTIRGVALDPDASAAFIARIAESTAEERAHD